MIKRKGFQHWLSTRIPKALTVARTARIFKALQNPELAQKKRNQAARLLIRGHMRLGMAVVSECYRPTLIDDLVGEMLLALTESVNRIVTGAIPAEHTNITAYIRASLRFRVWRFICSYSRILGVRIETHRLREKKGKPRFKQTNSIPVLACPNQNHRLLELKEVIDSVIENELERQIINLRLSGCTDVQIGEALDYTAARIGQIRRAIADRVKVKL